MFSLCRDKCTCSRRRYTYGLKKLFAKQVKLYEGPNGHIVRWEAACINTNKLRQQHKDEFIMSGMIRVDILLAPRSRETRHARPSRKADSFTHASSLGKRRYLPEAQQRVAARSCRSFHESPLPMPPAPVSQRVPQGLEPSLSSPTWLMARYGFFWTLWRVHPPRSSMWKRLGQQVSLQCNNSSGLQGSRPKAASPSQACC